MPKLYGSVNGQTEEVTKLYGSVEGPYLDSATIDSSATHITAIDVDIFRKVATNTLGLTFYSDTMTQLKINSIGTGTDFEVRVIYGQLGRNRQATLAELTSWGIAISDPGESWEECINTTVETAPVTKEITKLYGSVNGLAITGATPNTSATHITAVDLGTFRKNITAGYVLNAGTLLLSQFMLISYGDGTFFNTKAIYEGFDGAQRQMTLAQLASWGITVTNPELYWEEYIDITVTSIPHAEEIKKLYGSVNGLTKLVYSNS